MAEAGARRRSALADTYVPGIHGLPRAGGPQVRFAERAGLAIVQVEADAANAEAVVGRLRDAFGVAAPEAANTSRGGGEARLIWSGPWRWLAVEPERRDLEAHLAAALAGTAAAVVDLSHGRGVIRMGGHESRYVLAKGCGLNVHPRVLHAGLCAQTALFHVDVLIDCADDEPAFDIYAPRSLMLSLWQSLRRAAAEYGYRVL